MHDDEDFYCSDGLHAVRSVVTHSGAYRRKPCEQCPWRKDSPIGAFPPDAFKRSANTAYDMSTHLFGCHMSGGDKPATCAGFLLRGADHNMTVRVRLMQEQIDPQSISSDVELYDSYRHMAEANGVDPDDSSLKGCR